MIYKFNNYILDVSLRELLCDGLSQSIEPKAFDLLVALIENRDQVLSKDDLIEIVWEGRIVSEATISSRIKTARQAIGDNGKAQGLIKTFHGRGFRFIAAVNSSSASPLTLTQKPDLIDQPLTPALKITTPIKSKQASIVILPFQNMSTDPSQEFFADGVVEEITTVLYQIGELHVIARSSAFTYKGKTLDIRQVAEELNVRYVVEGSVRKAGKQIRITAQLIEADTNAHLWANNYDGTEENLFEFQDQIATNVAGILTSTILSHEISQLRHADTDTLTSEQYVLKGYDLLMSQSDRNFKDAAECFVKALQIAPDNMRAAALVSYCLSIKIIYFLSEDIVADRQKALALAERALQTVGDDVVALTSIASVYSGISSDQARANMLVDRVLNVSPNLPQAWILKGYIKTRSGHSQKGIVDFHKALSLSPRGNHIHFIYVGLSVAYFFDGLYPQALEWAQKAQAEQPNNPSSLMMVAVSAQMEHQYETAQKSFAHFLKIVPADITIQKILDRGAQMPNTSKESFIMALTQLGLNKG